MVEDASVVTDVKRSTVAIINTKKNAQAQAVQIADQGQEHPGLELYKPVIRRRQGKIAMQASQKHLLFIIVLKTLVGTSMIKDLDGHQFRKTKRGMVRAVFGSSRKQQMRGKLLFKNPTKVIHLTEYFN
jgi:hypothetical protein